MDIVQIKQKSSLIRRRICSFPCLAFILSSFIFSPIISHAFNAEEVIIKEWTVPWDNTRPRDPFVAPDGMVWFVGQGDDYAAYFNPQTEDFTRVDMESGAGPHNLIVSDDGVVWYAGNRASHIGKIHKQSASGDYEISKFPTPESTASDPHTLIQAQNGIIWFTAQHSNSVGNFNPETRESTILPLETKGSKPYGIEIDSKGNPWVVLFGTNKLLKINPQNNSLSEIELPRKDARPRRIAITNDDRIWYVDFAEDYLGVYDPINGEFKEWKTPGSMREGQVSGAPYGMAVDKNDILWFVEVHHAPNLLIGFDSKTETFVAEKEILPSGGGAVRHIYYDEKTNALWFGTDSNQLAQAKLP